MMKILMDFPSAYFPIQPFYVKKIKMRGVPLVQAEEMFSMAALGESIAIDRPSILTFHGD